MDSDLPFFKRTLLWTALGEFNEDRAMRSAAALSFYTLFSLIPLLFLVVAVVGFVSSTSLLLVDDCSTVTAGAVSADAENPFDRAIAQVNEVTGPAVADQLAVLTCQAGKTASGALWVGVVLAAFSGSTIFRHLQGVLNQMFDARDERTRGLVNQVFMHARAVLVALALGVLVLVPIVAIAAVEFLIGLVSVGWVQGALTVALPLVSLLMLAAVIACTYMFLPRVDVSFKAAAVGALLTSVAGVVGSYLLGVYLSSGFGRGGAFGAVGGVAILLFFFNIMWVIYLFGAEVTKVYARRKEPGSALPAVEEPPAPTSLAEGKLSAEPDSVWSSGIVTFLVGFLTGWAARKKL